MDARRQREAGEEESTRDSTPPVAPAPVLLAHARVRTAILVTSIAAARGQPRGGKVEVIVIGHWLRRAVVNIDGRLSDRPVHLEPLEATGWPRGW
jgi:hypothetical protein